MIPELIYKKRVTVELAAGNTTVAAVTESGEVFTWGYGGKGALGHGNTRNKDAPEKVTGMRGKKVGM